MDQTDTWCNRSQSIPIPSTPEEQVLHLKISGGKFWLKYNSKNNNSECILNNMCSILCIPDSSPRNYYSTPYPFLFSSLSFHLLRIDSCIYYTYLISIYRYKDFLGEVKESIHIPIHPMRVVKKFLCSSFIKV